MTNKPLEDNQVREISQILWQFHNDRLKDPSINEMKPYIQPILDLQAAQTRLALTELLENALKGVSSGR